MRCPDPTCAVDIPVDAWQVSELAAELMPWDADAPEVFRWFVVCPGCRRPISVHHGDTDVEVVDPDPADWCCPTCGRPARVVAENRGPVAAALRCKDGCGALIALSRLVAR